MPDGDEESDRPVDYFERGHDSESDVPGYARGLVPGGRSCPAGASHPCPPSSATLWLPSRHDGEGSTGGWDGNTRVPRGHPGVAAWPERPLAWSRKGCGVRVGHDARTRGRLRKEDGERGGS
jgi:hypothetical protein